MGENEAKQKSTNSAIRELTTSKDQRNRQQTQCNIGNIQPRTHTQRITKHKYKTANLEEGNQGLLVCARAFDRQRQQTETDRVCCVC